MNFEFLKNLEQTLFEGKIGNALSLIKNWLSSANPGDPQKLIESCSPSSAPKVALLLRDLIARYPNTIVGCPVLIYAESEILDNDYGIGSQDPLPTRNLYLNLPEPSSASKNPCKDLEFIGWIDKVELLPDPLTRDTKGRAVPWESMYSTIALFKSTPEFFDHDEVNIPAMWWGELLSKEQAHMRVAARMILSYPEAREAALVLEAAANNKPIPSPLHFLSDLGLNWALQEGLLFQDSCSRQFPSMRN